MSAIARRCIGKVTGEQVDGRTPSINGRSEEK
jgi:hypothetical protein